MIIKCPECGHQVSDRARTCPSCGVDIAGKVINCPDCGEYIFKDDHECPNCHCSINAAATEPEPVDQTNQITPSNPTIPIPAIDDTPQKPKKKSRFQQRLEEMQKQAEAMQKQREKQQNRR